MTITPTEGQETPEQQEGTEAPETDAETPEAPEQPEGAAEPGDGDGQDGEDTSRTFDYAYVKGLRDESQNYRTQLRETQGTVEALRESLWTSKLAALGKLADPTDLPLSEDVDPADDEAINAAVDELLSRKPHLAARRARGDIGQHDQSDGDAESFSILGAMKANA